MEASELLNEPTRLDEPIQPQGYADVLTRVASEETPVVLRRDGADFVAVVPMTWLELAREALAREECNQLARTIDWKRVVQNKQPPQSWFDGDEPKPF